MAKQMKRSNAKRANCPNPREDRNTERNSKRGSRRDSSHYDDTFDEKTTGKPIELLPRNISQEDYIDVLEDETKDIVFAMGPAGTGKSLLATLYALREFKRGNIKKIIITRPAVSTDESHGYLPGTLTEKLAPWCRPILDILKEYYTVPTVEKMIANEKIELAPLGFLRGRTFKDAIVILDEAQNATPDQMKMVLTRIGDGARIFVTGDIKQHDRGFEKNGLKDFVERLKARGSDRIGLCTFQATDIERHAVIEEVLELYGED